MKKPDVKDFNKGEVGQIHGYTVALLKYIDYLEQLPSKPISDLIDSYQKLNDIYEVSLNDALPEDQPEIQSGINFVSKFIQDLQATNSGSEEWIDIKEISENGEYLFWHKSFEVVIDVFDIDSYEENGGNGSGLEGHDIREITHFMPKPDKPNN